jgi:hypothetical protein
MRNNFSIYDEETDDCKHLLNSIQPAWSGYQRQFSVMSKQTNFTTKTLRLLPHTINIDGDDVDREMRRVNLFNVTNEFDDASRVVIGPEKDRKTARNSLSIENERENVN